MYSLYVLLCADDSYTVGVCKDIERRVEEHQSGNFPNLPTFERRPVKLVFQKKVKKIQDALALKSVLSEWTIEDFSALLAGQNALPDYESVENNSKNETILVLPTAYFPPISWMRKLKKVDRLIIAGGESYQKQTYRSRTTILGANGLLNLVVPVSRPYGKDSLTHELAVSYTDNWQKDHVKAITSAYGKAPYFNHYGEDIVALIEKNPTSLVNLNTSLIQFLIDAFDLNCTIEIDTTIKDVSREVQELMIPKVRSKFEIKPYYQVLGNDHFETNLSSLDALFNIGRLP